MTFNVNDPGHTAEHNRILPLLIPRTGGGTFNGGSGLAGGDAGPAQPEPYPQDAGVIETTGGGGNFAFGFAQRDGHITATEEGTWAGGYVDGGSITADADGSFAFGYVSNATASIMSDSYGGFVFGKAKGAGATIRTAGFAGGAGAFGYAYGGGVIQSRSPASLAFGYADGTGSVIEAGYYPYGSIYGSGSLVGGRATNGGIIRSFSAAPTYGYMGSDLGDNAAVFVFGQADGAGSIISGNANGALVGGVAINGGTIEGGSAGSFVWGVADDAQIYGGVDPGYNNAQSPRKPSFIWGRFSNGATTYTDEGATIIMGWADGANSYIGSGQPGGFAGGYAKYGGGVYTAGAGAFAFGYGKHEGRIVASSYGAAVHGVATGPNAKVRASRGSFANGYALSSSYPHTEGSYTVVDTAGHGAIAVGHARFGGTVRVNSHGAAAFGFADAGNSDPLVARSAHVRVAYGSRGGFASGCAYVDSAGEHVADVFVDTDAPGSHASGYVKSTSANSRITTSAPGAFAHGMALNKTITASGDGAFAGGRATAADITASGDGAFQWGPGTNAQADSLAVGADIRLSSATPGTPRNGDIWVANDKLYGRSSGETFSLFGVQKATFPDSISIALSDMTTQITTGTTKAYWVNPFDATLTVTKVKATLATAGSGSTVVDVNEGSGTGTSILSTKITIEASETDSDDATTQPVISDTSIAADGRLTFDIDTAGTSAAGLMVHILFTRAV